MCLRNGMCLVLWLLPVVGHAAELIWVEGENPQTQSVTRHPWWYDKVKKSELSGGDFISNWGDKPGEMTYQVEVPEEKEYEFWVRANPVGTRFSYQLDGSGWKPIDVAGSQTGNVNIAEDEKPDLRFVAWAKVGAMTFTKGKHTLAFKMHSDNNNHGMLDCFVLSAGPFTPNGALRPGQKPPPPRSQDGCWAFAPPKDEFQADALLDLRSLNEKEAGESGFIRRSEDGFGFVLGNGQPIRFWALNDDYAGSELARHARFIAKRGVNLARTFSGIAPNPKQGLNEINAESRDKLWRRVAAMKKEGIYTLYTPIWIGQTQLQSSMGYLDDGGNHNWGLLFFDKTLQKAYMNWMKQVLTEKNPYTGIPLAQDPALAFIQLQNEDSLLFWTQQGIKGAAKKELRKQFAAFLKTKYGSLDKAKEAWGTGGDVPGDQDAPDDFANGEAAIAILWEMTQRRGGEGRQKRLNDQMEFFCRTMYDFNKTVGDYLKNELGCKQLINADNWRTADNVILLDGERWAYSANDVMAVNRYYGGIHKGPNCGWAICNGDQFTDESVLLKPRALPITLKQVDGYPILVTESSWVPPQGYQSEGPFMIAAYQSLTGVAGYFWFAMGEVAWAEGTINSANGYLASQGKWICHTPMLMGQWPAAALMYRKGYIQRGAPAVFEERALQDIFNRSMPIIAEDEGYDPNRDKGLIPRESNIKDGVNPLAYLVGPVVAKYGGDPARSKVEDLGQYIDAEKKTVRSNTGELEIDYGTGLCTLNTPKAQGVTGFLDKKKAFKLADVEIQSSNPYATVLVVAVDDKPLKASGRVLVQVGTIARSTGWQTQPCKIDGRDGEQIVSFGKAPWQITNADVTVVIRNEAVTKARVVDVNFMPVAEVPLQADGAQKTLKFPANALYVILE